MGSNNLDAIIGKRESVFGKVSPLISALIVLLIQLPAVLFCDTKSQISGKVSDTQSKEMLIGANVILKGTSIGTVTDVDGKF
ncbi:MAG TPA: carboxypeptidase-like regulatory domain-containing protein, partial [Bacteroidota bacterium]|nr:carboxypeptidase-like regulatory domain-containing protein [Bacteroidota bacterium]